MIDTAKNIAKSMNVKNACFIKVSMHSRSRQINDCYFIVRLFTHLVLFYILSFYRIQDKHGNLPHHVACSRHVSPGKLEKLLEVNPRAMTEKNNQKATLLRLATSTATKSHPNNALIKYLEERMKEAGYEPQSRRCNHGYPAPGIKPPPPGGNVPGSRRSSNRGSPALGTKPSPLGGREPRKRVKLAASRTPLKSVHGGTASNPSPGPGMYNLTAAASFAAAASPGYAAHVGQPPQIKVKREGHNCSKQNTRRTNHARGPVPVFAVQQLNVQHRSPFEFMTEPQNFEPLQFQHPNQDPGDANLLLQFARGGSSDDSEINAVEV